MAQMHDGKYGRADESDQDELEQLLSHGVHFPQETPLETTPSARTRATMPYEEDDEEPSNVPPDHHIQGALAIFAEAIQDMATAALELSLGRHFACADFCNQAVEKAAQAVSVLRFGRHSTYDHDLGALGTLINAPQEIQVGMTILTPFHPEDFYTETPPEEADEIISAEQAQNYVQTARKILRWARNIVLHA